MYSKLLKTVILPLKLISNRAPRETAASHGDAARRLQDFRRKVERGAFGNFAELRAVFLAIDKVGAPIADEVQYERAPACADQVFDKVAHDASHPLGGLVDLPADRIREYEDRVHPWPDTSTPATVLASLMEEHGLKQTDLPEVGAQSVVSAVLAGKRQLNLRQVKALSKRFSVPPDMLT